MIINFTSLSLWFKDMFLIYMYVCTLLYQSNQFLNEINESIETEMACIYICLFLLYYFLVWLSLWNKATCFFKYCFCANVPLQKWQLYLLPPWIPIMCALRFALCVKSDVHDSKEHLNLTPWCAETIWDFNIVITV